MGPGVPQESQQLVCVCANEFWQFERFSFLEIQFEPISGQLHRAWIMDCHRSATFHNDPTRFEIISEKIAGVANGQRCKLHVL
jgi:hypothetical protein